MYWSVSPSSQADVLKRFCFFHPQAKDIQFTVIEEERKPENIHIQQADVRNTGK